MKPRQTEIPGTETDEPAVPPDLVDELDEYLGEEEKHKAEGERIRESRDTLVANMVRAGIARIPYTDSASGKRKYFIADTTARAKKISAAGSDGKAKRARERDVDVHEGVERPDPSKVFGEDVEKRRVSRKSVEKEIDGFAATRRAMDEDKVH